MFGSSFGLLPSRAFSQAAPSPKPRLLPSRAFSQAAPETPRRDPALTPASILRLIIWMGLLLSAGGGSALHAAQERWVAPQALGTGSGSSSTNAAAFSLRRVNEWLAEPAFTNLNIYFLAGTYTVSPDPAAQYLTGLTLRGGTNRSIALIGVSSLGVRPRLVLDSIQGNTHFSPNWTKSILHHWLIVSGTEAGKSSYLKRLVIENLELDGNFANQGAWTSEANATGYKSFAIDVAAESGWIRNVMVRNFGSVGPVPASHIHSGPGVEAFPVRFRSFAVTGQAVIGAAPNNFPWIVEDLELTDFHSIHGGYGTMIMPVVYQEPPRATVTDTPVAVIRRCQIRTAEGAIAFGTAGADSSPFPNVANLPGVISGRILFQDNVVTGAGAGFNTDTDSIGPLVFDNNAFLDVGFLGFLGQPDSGINHDGYLITNNLVRLRGRFNQKTWADITLTNYPNHTTNPNLPLGRYIPDDIFSGGLAIQGAAGRVYLGNNDFTTWPSSNFYLANPSDASKAKFWIVWKMPENQNINSWLYARGRPPVVPMGLYGTRLSGVSYDFKSFTTLDSGEVAQFRVNSPESTAVQHMDYRNALSGLPNSFVPRGRLRRVVPQMTAGPPSRLGRVREVQIGEVTYSGGTLTVPCRIVDHRLRASGLSPIETQAVGGQTLRLRCIRRDAAWIESTNDFTGLATSNPTNGLVTFTIPNLSNVSGLCRLTVWVDAGSGGIGTLEPDQDGWATFEYPLQTTANLPVVELTASPDVGDDKNTASAKRATLHITRSFATTNALTVNLTLPSGLYLRPGTSIDLAATYGFSGSADYNITGSSWTCASPYTTATLTIPANQTTATAQVVTRADQLTEQNLIVCRLAPATTYTPGASTNVNILIFDGPLWTLYPLEVSGYTNLSSAAYAISEINGSTPARVGGYSSYGYYSGTNWIDLSKGGYWSLPSTSFTSQENVVYAGISTSPLNLVGNLGSAARVTRTSGTDFNLPHLANSPSEAWGIVSDASLIVGSSRNDLPFPAPTQRPVAWQGSGTTYTAVDVGGSIPPSAPGSAYGANLSKQVVGEISVNYFTGWSGTVAFRSKSGTSVQPLDFDIVSGVGDILRAPGTSGGENKTARALAVNPSGHAVGYFIADLSSLRQGAFWPSTSLASDAGAIDLKAWKARIGPQADVWSVANSINGQGWIVGWSSLNSSPARAVIKFAASNFATDWIDLNDPHFVSGVTGWVLQNATAVNDSGQIVGNGTLSSAPRGFVLIPRTTGN